MCTTQRKVEQPEGNVSMLMSRVPKSDQLKLRISRTSVACPIAPGPELQEHVLTRSDKETQVLAFKAMV